MSTTTRAAIYTRVSSDEQVEGTSLATQADRCRAYADAQGWHVTGVYSDEGVSGAKADRPALDRLLADARAGRLDVVLVLKADRFSRNIGHLHTTVDALTTQGVGFRSVTEQFDTTSTSGRAMLGMLSTFAQMERDLIRERTQAGRQARVRQGGWGGGDLAPFGYRVEGSGRDAHLVLDEREAEVIRQAVTLVLDHGLTTGQTATRLNALGLTPRKVALWTGWNLRTCLTRGQWGGTWTFGKPGQQTFPVPVTQAVEPVLSPERWAALQAWLQATATSRGIRGDHPLSGRLVCSCGVTMYGMSRSGRKRRYHCSHAKGGASNPRNRGLCHEPTILADAADSAVWAAVLDLLTDPDRLLAMARERLGMLEGAQEVTTDALAAAEAAVERTQGALAQGAARCIAMGLDEPTMAATLAELRAQHLAAVEHRATVAAISQETAQARDRMTTAQRLAEVARDRLVNADAALQGRVLGLLDVRAEVQRDQGEGVRIVVTGSVAHDLLLGGLEAAAPVSLVTG